MKHYGKIQSDSPDTSEPIKVRGNVILIDFEEHSCIRTLWEMMLWTL